MGKFKTLNILWFFFPLVVWANPLIIGSAVSKGGSPSTCALGNTWEEPVCTATLLKDGTFRVAAHCVAHADEFDSFKVFCGPNKEGFQYVSRLKRIRITPEHAKRLDDGTLPNDSASFEAENPLLTESGIVGANALNPKNLDLIFDLAHSPASLKEGVQCHSESYGPDESGKSELRSAPVPSVNLENGSIRYSMNKTINKATITQDPLNSCFGKKQNLFATTTILQISNALNLSFLTIRGDSGSPLYCRDSKGETYLAGTLTGSLNRYTDELTPGQIRSQKERTLRVGSFWIPLKSTDEMDLAWERKDKDTRK